LFSVVFTDRSRRGICDEEVAVGDGVMAGAVMRSIEKEIGEINGSIIPTLHCGDRTRLGADNLVAALEFSDT
jgi:uncharacterized protein (DUF697 family)